MQSCVSATLRWVLARQCVVQSFVCATACCVLVQGRVERKRNGVLSKRCVRAMARLLESYVALTQMDLSEHHTHFHIMVSRIQQFRYNDRQNNFIFNFQGMIYNMIII